MLWTGVTFLFSQFPLTDCDTSCFQQVVRGCSFYELLICPMRDTFLPLCVEVGEIYVFRFTFQSNFRSVGLIKVFGWIDGKAVCMEPIYVYSFVNTLKYWHCALLDPNLKL